MIMAQSTYDAGTTSALTDEQQDGSAHQQDPAQHRGVRRAAKEPGISLYLQGSAN